jgi:hypothetical protein
MSLFIPLVFDDHSLPNTHIFYQENLDVAIKNGKPSRFFSDLIFAFCSAVVKISQIRLLSARSIAPVGPTDVTGIGDRDGQVL